MIWTITLTYICTSVLNNQYDDHEFHIKRLKKDTDCTSVLHDHNYTSMLYSDFSPKKQLEEIVVGKDHDKSIIKKDTINELNYMNLFHDDEGIDDYQSVLKLSGMDDYFVDNCSLFEYDMADLFSEENAVESDNSTLNELQVNNNVLSFDESVACKEDKYDDLLTNNTNFSISNDQEKNLADFDQNIKTNATCVVANKDDLSFKEKEEIFAAIYEDILQYIMNRISKTYHKMYIVRLEGINYALKTLDKYELDFNEYKQMYFFSDIIYMNEFNHLSLDKNNMFDQSTRHDFFYNLESNISKTQKSRRRAFFISAGDKKQLYFMYEFVKLYKYINDIPEILALGCLLRTDLFSESVHFLHLINLFIENKGIKDKSFIMCLIDKAISTSPKYNTNILTTPILHLKSKKACHDVGFFLWELDSKIKRDILSFDCLEMDMNKIYSCNYVVNDHLDLVFLFYIYQHSIFMKYHNKSLEDVKIYKKCFDKIMSSVQFFGYFFDEYLNVLKEQLKTL
jgi:hypothetical protein